MRQDMGAPTDGLSQAEPVARLGPSGFDPSRNNEWYNRLYVAYRIHQMGHEALTLQKQIVRMTIDSIRRGPPRMRMLRAFERDAIKVRDIAERIRDLAAIAMEARKGGDGETRLHAKHDSASRRDRPSPSSIVEGN